jgi:DNA primase
MQVPEEDASPQDRARAAQQREKQATLTDVLEKACDAYRKHLKESPRAVDYLKRRGVSGAIAKQFGLGYAPEGWRSLASVFPSYDDPLLAESGLVIVNEDEDKRYDRFRDRVMFPIRNVKGECIGFGGRVLGDGSPKYLNSPETPVFSKGRELYGLFEARNALREHGYVLVTEGYMDVVALAQLGFPNVVATLGTACTAEHVHKLFRFTDSVVFSFDGDEAGRRAARKALDAALPYATDVRSVKFLFLPSEHDPDSYIREFGRDAFARYVGDATPLSRFLIDAAREGCDLGSAEGRAHMAANAKPLWLSLPEGALKRQLLNELANLVELDSRELGQIWSPTSPATYSIRRPWKSQEQGAFAPRIRRFQTPPSVEANAKKIALLLLRDSKLWEELSSGDHEVLSGLEGPFGDFFRWLEVQTYEHGPQPMAAVLAGLPGQPFEQVIQKLAEYDRLQPWGREVQDLVTDLPDLRLAVVEVRIDVLAEQIKAVEALPSTDPTKAQRHLQLIRGQMALREIRMGLKKLPAGIM